MQVHVNPGNGVGSKDSLDRWATDHLTESLSRFKQDVNRVDLQLGDESRDKSGATDKTCTLEARITGREPLAVHHGADNMDAAIRGATTKLIHALDHVFGKLDRKEHRDRETIRRDPSAIE